MKPKAGKKVYIPSTDEYDFKGNHWVYYEEEKNLLVKWWCTLQML